ncbi:MAG TPA: sodium:proline symporter [Casimicrobiaceae bacterium]
MRKQRARPPGRVHVGAAVYAGIAGGILGTIVQIVLWAVFAENWPTILFRDARFAAAIVMGRSVLPPPATFDWPIMLVATLVHFALSILYALILAGLIARRPTASAVVTGAVYGLLLYAVNMFGFTVIFPWFAASRDWITAAAHGAFGAAAAGAYRLAVGASEKRTRR